MYAAKNAPPENDAPAFGIVLGGTLFLIVVAYGVGLLLGAPPLASFAWNPGDAALGVVATAPLVAALIWLMRGTSQRVIAFRESQFEFLESVGFRFTTSRIILLSMAAGTAEELLFRGVFQTSLAAHAPLWAAIVLPNILFGALHARTLIYALIAGVVGIWFGFVFALTNNILTPIVAHALYDLIALDATRRALLNRASRRRAVPQ